MINDINNSLKTPAVGAPRLRLDPVADDPFGSDADLDAFLSGWVQSDTSNLDTLAQVASAPVQAPASALPSPDDDATRGIEFLVVQHRSLFEKAAAPQNAPSRLLMTEDNSTLRPSGGVPGIFSDANAWKLFDASR